MDGNELPAHWLPRADKSFADALDRRDDKRAADSRTRHA